MLLYQLCNTVCSVPFGLDCHQALPSGPRLDGRSVYRALEEFKCDSTSGVPTVVLGLLDYMTAAKKQLHHLKMVRIGGAACPPKIVTKFSRCCFVQSVLFLLLQTSIVFTAGMKVLLSR